MPALPRAERGDNMKNGMLWTRLPADLTDEVIRHAGGQHPAAALRRDLWRYYGLLGDDEFAAHGLTEREMALVWDAIGGGCNCNGDMMVSMAIGSIRAFRLDARYDVDGGLLATKLMELTPLQRLRVLDDLATKEGSDGDNRTP
jgi:hypothetical protein